MFGRPFRQGGDVLELFNQQRLKLWTAQRGKGGGRRHIRQRIDAVESTQEKNDGLPTLLPLLLIQFFRAMRGTSPASQTMSWGPALVPPVPSQDRVTFTFS